MNEKISALIDEELDREDRDRQFNRVLADEKAGEAWQRYHLIGSVIRNEVSSPGRDLTSDIREKLESEPTVLAPMPKKKTNPGSADVWSAAGLFAVAASIALVAVVSFNPVSDNNNANQVAFNQVDQSSATKLVNSALDQKRITDEFGEMLVEHGEFSSSTGLNGLVAYAKLVSNQSMDQ